jgi:uncharacterized protein YdcH (DUF465 family)
MFSAPRHVRQLLLESDAELRKLDGEHRELDAQVEQLGRSPYLSGEDRIRLATLKKLKLRIRDRMEELIARRWEQMPGRTAEGSPSHSGVE